MSDSNVIFDDNRDYIAIPSDAVSALSPGAMELLEHMLVQAQSDPNATFEPTKEQKGYLHELMTKKYVSYSAKYGWHFNF